MGETQEERILQFLEENAGRTSREEITIFDSTDTALQNVAVAAIVYERALRAAGRG